MNNFKLKLRSSYLETFTIPPPLPKVAQFLRFI